MKLIIDIPKDVYEKAKTMGEAFGFPSPIVKAVAHGTPIIEARQETLEQEPKTGHWLPTKFVDRTYECDNCHGFVYEMSRYCPNCGAKMVGK